MSVATWSIAMETRIRELREKNGLTQEILADKVGVTRQTILFLEKGKYNPSLRLAYKIARVFGVMIEDVFSFEDETPKP
jgi:putative transcriptional regulator